VHSPHLQSPRRHLLARREIALLDVREEDPHAQRIRCSPPTCPSSRIELDAYPAAAPGCADRRAR
jgi:hypothetical protein